MKQKIGRFALLLLSTSDSHLRGCKLLPELNSEPSDSLNFLSKFFYMSFYKNHSQRYGSRNQEIFLAVSLFQVPDRGYLIGGSEF